MISQIGVRNFVFIGQDRNFFPRAFDYVRALNERRQINVLLVEERDPVTVGRYKGAYSHGYLYSSHK